MKSYSLYKDIDLDFLDTLPEHWDIAKLKYLASISFSSVDKHSFEYEIPVRLCNYVDVYKNDFISSDMPFMQATATESEIERFTLCKGDVLITKDSESWEDIAVPAYVTEDINGVLCGYHLALIRPSAIDPKYLFWVFYSSTLNDQYKVEAHGITRYGLGKDSIENSVIPVPSLPEQQAIAHFLDCKTAQINTLVEKKQRQIDLLQEQRTALINQAVTKGLNPDAPMRGSGVEWLGEIPSHWDVKRLRHACDEIFLGLTSKVDYIDDDNGYPLVRANNITNGKLDFSNVRYISKEQHSLLTKYRRAIRGDVLLSKSGSIGTVAVVDTDREFSIYESIFALRANKLFLDPRHLYYALQSHSCQAQYKCNMVGMGVSHLNMSDIIDVLIPIPPLTEQERIIEYLRHKLEKIEKAKSLARENISWLQEYRTTLISEAVTGKIDVKTAV
jgi:type I restriction enzyme, S subunit